MKILFFVGSSWKLIQIVRRNTDQVWLKHKTKDILVWPHGKTPTDLIRKTPFYFYSFWKKKRLWFLLIYSHKRMDPIPK